MVQDQCLEVRIANAIETLIAYGPKVADGTATTTERKEWREAREAYDAHQIYLQGMKRRPLFTARYYAGSLLDDIWATIKVMAAVLLLFGIVIAFWAVLFGIAQGMAQLARP